MKEKTNIEKNDKKNDRILPIRVERGGCFVSDSIVSYRRRNYTKYSEITLGFRLVLQTKEKK
jgi:hypothetical protein